METALLSIIIPTYNSDSCTLKNTLSSVVKQTYSNLEIIVVDDGSNNLFSCSNKQIIEQINDSRIFYYELEHRNANVARNFGIQKSNGQYIAMLDSDDEWLENHLMDCLQVLLEEQVDGLYGSLIIKNSATSRNFITNKPLKDESMINFLLRTGSGAQTSTLFMTAESAKNILWDPDLNRHQDYDFVVRYCEKYKMTPKLTPTVICNLSSLSTKKIDFNSCIKFIRKNRKYIDPILYNKYNLNMLMLSKDMKASPKIIKYYQKEATRYKEYMSFQVYMSIINPENRKNNLLCKLIYIDHILRVQVAYKHSAKI